MSRFITSLFLLYFVQVTAQSDSDNLLEEILLNGNFSSSLNSGYRLEKLNDSILKSNYQSLGDLLQNEVNLYFKQNGNGMVSSISLRGTSASQTGVYWNGIALNSTLNGQVDFNTLSAGSFDEVEIKRGGGSVLLGSGAIGGAINLSDRVVFEKNNKSNLFLGIGSYNTFETQFNGLFSTNKIFAKISLGASSSVNDYPYFNSPLKNENGEYKNYNFNGSFAFSIDKKNSIGINTSYFDNNRNTSRTLTATSNAKLLNEDSRNLIEWKHLGDRFTSTLKFAYLYEEFTFIFGRNTNKSSTGKSNNLIGKYDFTYFLNNKIFFKSGLEYKNAKGKGDNIANVEQNDFTAYLLFHHKPINKLNYNVSLRKGASSIYSIPFIYAVDVNYKIHNKINVKGAFSTNYRLPTFNDLYWVPGGNSNLRSETSISTELGLTYTVKSFDFSLTTYLIKSKDMIQWRPVSNIFWQPQNIQNVSNYGVELFASFEKRSDQHLFRFKLYYDYTKSKDEDLNKELIYVPNHKANVIFSYLYKNWNFVYNLQFTGKVFTTTSNTQSLDSYLVSNINIGRSFLKRKNLIVAFKVNNLFDENYQSVAFRPMPNRNYTININLKF